MASPQPEIMTLTEIADYLKVAERTLYRLVASEKIPAFKVGGAWRFAKSDIEARIRSQVAGKFRLGIAPMVSDPKIKRIAVDAVIAHEEAQGRIVESVEADNRGFDLISRMPHPEDPICPPVFTAAAGQAIQALSALYPASTNEKCWVDAVLARKKDLGL